MRTRVTDTHRDANVDDRFEKFIAFIAMQHHFDHSNAYPDLKEKYGVELSSMFGQTWWHLAFMTTIDGNKAFFSSDTFQSPTTTRLEDKARRHR